MATIAQIREGLRARLATIAGWQPSAYMLANPTPPAMHVFPELWRYDGAMQRGMDMPRFTVQAFTGLTSDIGAQKKLDELLNPTGATSVKAAIEGDKTLGGTVDQAHVTEVTGYRIYQLEGRGAVLGCEWAVEIVL